MLVLGLLVLKLTVFFVETLVVITDDMPCCNNSLIVLTVLDLVLRVLVDVLLLLSLLVVVPI